MRSYFLFGIILILTAAIASASFEVNETESFVETNYIGGELVRGGVLMSFDRENNDKFTSNFEGEMKLLDILKSMDYDSENYTCDPLDCSAGLEVYPGDAGEESRPIDFGQIYGFKLDGSDVKIKKFWFNVTSDVEASCSNQLQFDLLNDAEPDFSNLWNAGGPCEEISQEEGCFDDDATLEDAIITTLDEAQYCEKVTLAAAPGYELGAKVGGTGGRLELRLYDNGGGSAMGCSQSPLGGVVSCNVNRSSNVAFDGFVCISAENSGDSYTIKTESEAPVCGGAGSSVANLDLTNDFELYARPLKYAQIGNFEFNRQLYLEQQGEDSLISLLNGYLEDRYGKDCSNDCIIPLKFSGAASQSVIMDGVFIEYEKNGLIKSQTVSYKILNTPFTISSDFLVLDIEKMGFEVPNKDGSEEFGLEFGGNNVLEEEVNIVAGVNFEISPLFALVGRETTFRTVTGLNVSSSSWDFDDGTVVQSIDGTAKHIYRNDSEYDVEVSITSSGGTTSTKKFKVMVGNAKRSANLTIQEYSNRLESIEEDLGDLPAWVQTKAKEELGLDQIKAQLNNVKASYSLSTEEDEYVQIAITLLEMDVPLGIAVTESGSLPMALGLSGIKPDYIGEVSDVSVTDADSVRNGIIIWLNENYNPLITFRTLSVLDEESESVLLTSYDVKLQQKQGASESQVYLLIDYPLSDLDFKSSGYNSAALSSGAATRVLIDGANPGDIGFVIVGTSGPSVESLGMYISPVVSELDLLDVDAGIQKNEFNYNRFLLGLIVLLIVVFAIYMILQTWYKRHYEKHLFKNPNDLYNLINFIYNSRKEGLSDKEIKKNLSAKKWSGEQIRYAFKKLLGKRTGMWEIPLFKFIENRKVKKELEKKNPGKLVDAKFIKMPNLE